MREIIKVKCSSLDDISIRYYKIPDMSKKVLQFDLNGRFIKEWPSASEAARQLNIKNQGITRCCRKERVTYKGFYWKYV